MLGAMYLQWRQRRNQFHIEVTYASGAVRLYGPMGSRQEATTFAQSRMVASNVATPRGVEIQGWRVVRARRQPDFDPNRLLGVRFFVL